MNTVIEQQLEKLKEPFIKALDYQCAIYKSIGSWDESPIWYVFGGIKDGKLRFTSSQRRILEFYVPCGDVDPRQFIGFNEELGNYFKYLKYDHIINNHPTIWNDNENSDFNKARVMSFMRSWNS